MMSTSVYATGEGALVEEWQAIAQAVVRYGDEAHRRAGGRDEPPLLL